VTTQVFSTTTLPPAVVRDVNDIRRLQLNGVDDLTSVSAIRGWAWLPWKRAQTVTQLVVTVEDPVERIVAVNLGDGTGWLSEATPHDGWLLEVEADFADGSQLTWPAREALSIAVRQDGG
jgi:hypothetical protein